MIWLIFHDFSRPFPPSSTPLRLGFSVRKGSLFGSSGRPLGRNRICAKAEMAKKQHLTLPLQWVTFNLFLWLVFLLKKTKPKKVNLFLVRKLRD